MGIFKKKKQNNLVEPIVRLSNKALAKAWDEGFEAAQMLFSDELEWEFYTSEALKNPYRENEK